VPLAFEVVLLPPLAGPLDRVQLILQVANLGYSPLEDIAVSVSLPRELAALAVDCARCVVTLGPNEVRLAVGRLAPGEQVIAPITVQVAADAWPGQTLRTGWILTATAQQTQTLAADLTLPWAPLPPTGGVP
jgi:hypothetical protein